MTENNDNLDPLDTRAMDGAMFGNVNRMPFEVTGALGSSLALADGSQLLDFWGDEGVQSLGYNTPELLKAVLGFFGHGNTPHQLPDIYPNGVRWEAASRLTEATGMDKVFFANSGAEANEGMIKLARKYWWSKGEGDRFAIMTISGNFHGRTGLAMAASDFRVSPYHREGMGPIAKGFGVLSDDLKLECYDGECVSDGGEVDWSTVAAITMAPVLGNNCVKTYPKEFWERLGEIRREHGTLIMFDDVQAGFGRAGYVASWQNPDIGLKPDIMCIAKGMAMGFPMSTLYARREVAAAFTPGTHFNTFGGSPFVCWMAMRMLDWLDENLGAVQSKGQRIREWFGDDEQDWIKEHDGAGMLNAFTPDFKRFNYDGYAFIHKAREFGLSLATHRKYGAIRFTPPLNVSEEDLEKAFEALRASHRALSGA